VRSVVAHELGHAKDNDVFTGTLLGALGASAGVVGIYLLGSWTGLLRRAGVDSIAEPRAIGLVLAVVAVAGLVSGPATNYVSRHIEARADTHALRLTNDPDTFAAMQARLSELNLANPDRTRSTSSCSPRTRPRCSGSPPPGVRQTVPVTKTLLVTNDFPPRPRRDPAVRAQPRRTPAARLDRGLRLRLAGLGRLRRRAAVPGHPRGHVGAAPGAGGRAAGAAIAREHGCDTVWFGAAAPLGLLAAGLRKRAGIRRAVALTHGHEVGWAALPGARAALRRIADGVDVMTYLSEYQRVRLDRALRGRTVLAHQAPGVDTALFHPGADGASVRDRYGVGDGR